MTSPLSPEAVAQMVADRDVIEDVAKAMCLRRMMEGIPEVLKPQVILALENLWQNGATDIDARQRANYRADAEIAVSMCNATLAAENATLRASEAAALERVAAALEIAKTQHIADQPAYSSASDLGWAHQQYASLRRDIIAALTPTADKEPKT